MLKRLTPILALALVSANMLSAATYYVAKTGSDSYAGSQAAPWLTISKAAGVAKAGDVVNVAAGTYNESITFSASGASGSPITFIGTGSPTVTGNVTFNGNYVTMAGMHISPPGPLTGAVYGTEMSGVGDVFSNCLFDNFGATAAQQATMIVMQGSFDVVKGCTIQNLNDIDVFHIWGHDQLIQGNIVTNIQQLNYNLNHTDFVQSWGPGTAYNIVVDGNLIVDSTCQSGNTETDQTGTNISNWIFRNNIWANVQNPFYSGIPQTMFYNNIFYRTAQNSGSGDQAISFYTSTVSGNQRSSAGNMVINNAFIMDGSNPASASLGGIGSDGTDLTTLLVSNNYFGGTGFAAKSGAYIGSNPINGGDPKFANMTGYDFHIGTNSVLIGKGINLSAYFANDRDGNLRPTSGSWDVGAYVFNGTGGTGGGGNTNTNQPPVVSAITQNASDVDPNNAGVQVYEGTTVQYSATASDPLGNPINWVWEYSVNGGATVVFQSGSGTVPAVNFTYSAGTGAAAPGNTYVWSLVVTDTVNHQTAQSSLTMSVETPPAAGAGLSFAATSGTLSGPMTVTGNYISQAVQTTVIANAGEAAFNFTISNAGNYVIQALVNASGDSANSFYVNIDAQPVDPTMCWDIFPLTTNFENRVVSWRGTGSDTNNQYTPKIFNLATGAHQIIFAGREAGTELQSFSLLQMPNAPANLRVLPTVVNAPAFSAGGP